MKNICFITQCSLPIPTTKGGAVETLVEYIVDENEREKKYNITVISVEDEKAKEISKKHKNTKYIYINKKNKKINNILFYIYRVLKHFGIYIPFSLEFAEAIRKIKSIDNQDYYIYEAGPTTQLKALSRIIPKEKLLVHLHWDGMSNKRKDECFSYLIPVSDYIGKQWMKNTNRKDDLELLTIVVDWVKAHGDNLPQVTSTSDQERKYAATLYRIQQKYIEYRNGIDEEEVTEEERKNIEKIIAKGEEIELWDRELEEIPKGKIGKILDVDSFEVKGYLHDFVELDKEVEGLAKRNTIDEFIEKLEKLQEIGVDVSKIVQRDTILRLTQKTLKEPEEILIQRIKGIGLNPDDKIGSKKNNIKFYYNKSQKGKDVVDRTIATEEQVEKIRSFGIKIGEEITGQSIGQASYTANVQECDDAQAKLNRLVQEQQTKEGGKH